MVTLYIFRHGETDWNRELRLQGQTDVPLNDKGREQALALREVFISIEVDVVLSSTLKRASETSDIVFSTNDYKVIRDKNLKEFCLGDLEGKKRSDVVDEFGVKIKLVLDGGLCKIGLESTIVDLTNRPSILRLGSITQSMLQKILKQKVILRRNVKKIKSPGQLKFHYSPGIPVFMNKKYPKLKEAFITFGKGFKDNKNYFNLSQKGSLKEAANNLYKTMRKIKKQKYKSIAVCKIPNIGIGQAINDRLNKASYK